MDVKRNHCSVGMLGVLTSSLVFVVIFVGSSSAMPMWEKITTIPDVRWVSVILFIYSFILSSVFIPAVCCARSNRIVFVLCSVFFGLHKLPAPGLGLCVCVRACVRACVCVCVCVCVKYVSYSIKYMPRNM